MNLVPGLGNIQLSSELFLMIVFVSTICQDPPFDPYFLLNIITLGWMCEK